MPDPPNTPEVWNSKDKFNAALETAGLSEAEVAEYCRSQGIHTRNGPRKSDSVLSEIFVGFQAANSQFA